MTTLKRLQELGISWEYTAQQKETVYTISIENENLISKRHLSNIVTTLAKDAGKRKGKITCKVIGNETNKKSLESIARMLAEEAKEKSDVLESIHAGKFTSGVYGVLGTAAVGGLISLIWGYDASTERATSIAESMNNYSHLLAPLTGLLQSGIAITGTLLCTALGAAIAGVSVSGIYLQTLRRGLLDESYMQVSTALTEQKSDESPT